MVLMDGDFFCERKWLESLISGSLCHPKFHSPSFPAPFGPLLSLAAPRGISLSPPSLVPHLSGSCQPCPRTLFWAFALLLRIVVGVVVLDDVVLTAEEPNYS